MTTDIPSLIVSVPTAAFADDLVASLQRSGDEHDVEVVVWPMDGPPPREDLDIVVQPYMSQGRSLPHLGAMRPRLLQGQAIGYDGVEDHLPAGLLFANASSVHEASTAELAVGLMLAAQRHIPRFVRAQERHEWSPLAVDGLADRRVLLLGYGGVGKAIAARLEPFEVSLTFVARTARDEDGVHVHGVDELPALLAGADILVLSLPGGDGTRHIIDDAALSALPDGALVVNVGRGSLIDTDALVAHVARGRIRAALDVVNPEPLPADHPLWDMDGVLISPHVGGATSAMRPRITRLLHRQITRMRAGEPPLNVVLGGPGA